MEVRYSFLAGIDLEQLHQTHSEAFSDYQVDMSYMTKERIRLRGIKNSVKYEYSVGAFARERLVGFTLIGVDEWQEGLAAYDAATGIIPDFRGRGIAGGMFDFSLPKLKEQGVNKFLLEVLRPNEAAIKAYSKTGFKVTREFDCFKLDLKTAAGLENRVDVPGVKIEPVSKEVVAGFAGLVDWQPSWENSFSAIGRIIDEITMFGAFADGQCIGIIVYYPLLNWVMSLVVKKEFRRRGIGRALVGHLLGNLPAGLEEIKLINVENTDLGMIEFLKSVGFEFIIGQYEMAYDF